MLCVYLIRYLYIFIQTDSVYLAHNNPFYNMYSFLLFLHDESNLYQNLTYNVNYRYINLKFMCWIKSHTIIYYNYVYHVWTTFDQNSFGLDLWC